MILPPFKPPKYDELRAWYRQYQSDDVRRLIFEVQAQRYALPEIRALADACRIDTENDQPQIVRMKKLNQLLRMIDAEISRADKIYRSPPVAHPNAPTLVGRGS
jgi:DNA-binding transcriptional MerR regulator